MVSFISLMVSLSELMFSLMCCSSEVCWDWASLFVSAASLTDAATISAASLLAAVTSAASSLRPSMMALTMGR